MIKELMGAAMEQLAPTGGREIGKLGSRNDLSDAIPDFKGASMEKYQDILINRLLPANDGKWLGEKGNSDWIPDNNSIPKKYNEVNHTMGEILDEYGKDRIPFKDGYPDFSEFSISTVEIENFTDARPKNFAQADRLTTEKWNEEKKFGKDNWKPSDVEAYRTDNSYSWHECEDMKTLQLVPREVHANVPHDGGVSAYKKASKEHVEQGGENEKRN